MWENWQPKPLADNQNDSFIHFLTMSCNGWLEWPSLSLSNVQGDFLVKILVFPGSMLTSFGFCLLIQFIFRRRRLLENDRYFL